VGESYWYCYRRARKQSEYDLQLQSEHRRSDHGSSSEKESRNSDGAAVEEIDESPGTTGAIASTAACHNNYDVCADELLLSEDADSDSEYDSISDTSSSTDSTDQPSLTEQLAVWAKNAIFLEWPLLLKTYHPFLPSDARLLQHTCRKYDITKLDNGDKYYHTGLLNLLNLNLSESLTGISYLYCQYISVLTVHRAASRTSFIHLYQDFYVFTNYFIYIINNIYVTGD